MGLVLLFGIILLLLLLGYVYLKRPYTQGPSGLSSQEPQFFFGNLINSGLLTGKSTFHEIMQRYQRQYGDKFVFWFGSTPCITFCLSEHAQAILANRQAFDQSPLFLPNFDLLCPHGIFMPTGPKWKRHIRVMLPMFKKAKVIHHLDTIVECTDRLIEKHFRDGDIHRDLLTQCRSLTMNIIGWIGFDYDFDRDLDSSLKNAFQTFTSQATLLMVIPWMPRWSIRLYLKMNWKYQHAHRLIRQLTEKIVEQEQENRVTNENERPKNLIASLVSSLNEQANDEQISSGLRRVEMLDEVLVSILAGYETTSTSLSWFIFYMSKNPHVQQRIKDELREHDLLATNDDERIPALTYEKVESLVYCECVTKEVRRSLRRWCNPLDDLGPSLCSGCWCYNTYGYRRYHRRWCLDPSRSDNHGCVEQYQQRSTLLASRRSQ